MIALYICLTLIGGVAIGYFTREIRELSHRVSKIENKPQPSQVTFGSYRPANETKQVSGVINPKTPQQMEALSQERTRQEVLGVGRR